MNDKKIIILDTNILISAILYKGIPLKILDLCTSSDIIDIAISPELMAELIGKLKYKFKIKNHTLEQIKNGFEDIMINVLPEYTTRACRDDSDNKIIDLAICAGAKFIITGDKDLLELKIYKGIKILKASEFLELI